jgi:hypothetical protein
MNWQPRRELEATPSHHFPIIWPYGAMILKKLSPENAISPYPAKTIADLELDEKVYKPDFEITSKYQAFSKEIVRIFLLGLAVYGFLIKLASEQKLPVTQFEKIVGLCGLVAFAISAGCALLHGVSTRASSLRLE